MANIILGVVSIVFGLWGLNIWWWSVVEVVRGIAPVIGVLFGLVAIGAGISRLREKSEEEDPDDLEEDEFEASTATADTHLSEQR